MSAAHTTSGPFVSRAPKLGLVGSFDGVRGTGVMLVLIGHALFIYFESLVTIVDTFFVLSGFLITTLLLQEHRSTDDIGLRKFYARRAVRLLPSIWLFCAVWIVIGVIGTVLGVEAISLTGILADAGAAVAYVYHLFFPNGLYMIDPGMQDDRYMWHLWTLSVEEWFYFAIPATVLVCIRRNWIRQLAWVLGGLFVAIGVARFLAFTGFFQGDEDMIAGVRLFFLQRPDGLMLGALLAIVNAHLDEERIEGLRRPLIWVGTAGIVLWLAMLTTSSGFVERLGGPYFPYLPDGPEEFTRAHMLDQEPMYWFRFGHTLGALAFGAMLMCLVHQRHWWMSRFFAWRPFQWMGRLSYTLYVWHALPYIFILALTGGEEASLGFQLARTPVLIASAFLVSLPVYYLVELRVLRMKLRFSAEKETLDLSTGKMVRVEGGRVLDHHADGTTQEDRSASGVAATSDAGPRPDGELRLDDAPRSDGAAGPSHDARVEQPGSGKGL